MRRRSSGLCGWGGAAWRAGYVVFLAASFSSAQEVPPAATRQIDYAAEVQPIFEANCYRCHGPQVQKAELRLDEKDAAMAGGISGPAIVPGKSAASQLIHNVSRLSDATPMPPKGNPLTPDQIGILRAWIDQGADWSGHAPTDKPAAAPAKKPSLGHWSFKPPIRSPEPEVKTTVWPRNPIDRFVLAKLEKEGLAPSPETDRTTLIRRLHLDLIGLPPSIADVDAFVADLDPGAYEKLVDRLLASPAYGERWGRRWLDAARYADTNGYEKDRPRSIWPYRDWVIRSLNQDLPFNQFAIEQIAGDMLPGSTVDQKIATGFHRNTMINEEGGIDVEEYRYHSIVDRVATTGSVFLGLTIGCAQCHDHKYDPISQREYYGIYAFLNNTDEPDLEVPSPHEVIAREVALTKIARLESELEGRFPPYDEKMNWEPLEASTFRSTGGAELTKLEDGSILALGPAPEQDTYEIETISALPRIDAIRLETMTEPRLPKTGPGRSGNGTFTLTEFKAQAGSSSGAAEPTPVKFSKAEADYSQKNFGIEKAIDGDAKTGWAIGKASGTNVNQSATFHIDESMKLEGGTRLRFHIEQSAGGSRTIGRFRLGAGQLIRSHYRPELSPEAQRKAHLAEKLAAWEADMKPKCATWSILDACEFKSENRATLTKQADGSILVTGDRPNKDVYELKFRTDLKRITAIRIEALPHPSLPSGGPGRGIVLDPGNFMLNELKLTARKDANPENTATFAEATADYAQKDHPAEHAIDGKLETGWAIGGGQGQAHAIVFRLKEPMALDAETELALRIDQHFIHQDTMGHFRVSATSAGGEVHASGLPADIESSLIVPSEKRTPEQRALILRHFLMTAPELTAAQKEIAEVRKGAPPFPTTMVMEERSQARTANIHPRGEFLRTGVAVEPDVPAVLPPLPADSPKSRLTFARWLVDDVNPLTARVTVNRVWQEYFGRGLVATSQDFGTQGEKPSHPELLDWLATEFMRQGWSMKALHRLIVNSATYRQSSRMSPEMHARDPQNVLLARGPRFRIDAEVIRDVALSASGLLNPKMGGPSVFPPQPEGVSELAYGSPKWPASTGEDRYRRGIYTHLKRTAPYPAFTTFDGPTADQACLRRMRSNTPLQALTILNDEVFVEAAQAMARRVLAEGPKETEGRARLAFRLCVARPPTAAELNQIKSFHDNQLARLRDNSLDATKLASLDAAKPPSDIDPNELAAWTAVARALLNLDETVTKE